MLAQPSGICDKGVRGPLEGSLQTPRTTLFPMGTTVSFTDGETRRLISGAAGPKPTASDPEPVEMLACPGAGPIGGGRGQ